VSKLSDFVNVPTSLFPHFLGAVESTVAEGNNSLGGLTNKMTIERIIITTTSTNWTLTSYSQDDYSSDPQIVAKTINGDVYIYTNVPYEDESSTNQFHYNFTSASGSETHDIDLRASELK